MLDRREFVKLVGGLTTGVLPLAAGRPYGAAAGAAGKYTVAVYYFPGWHRKNANAWKRLEAVKPVYKGQYEPEVPFWGHLRGNNPATMEKYIAAMTTHGINTVIFDWYRFQTTRILEGSLRDGFLHAANRRAIKFALMWANQSVPGHRAPTGRRRFDQIADDAINYFKHPCYWKIDGKPYFSVYLVGTLVRELGGVAKTRAALEDFRRRAIKAGLPGIYFNLITWADVGSELRSSMGQPLPQQPTRKIKTLAELIAALGFDSTTWYTWTHWVAPVPVADYKTWGDAAIAFWKEQPLLGVPFFPNVTMGWDGMPQHEKGVVLNNTPRDFKNFLLKARNWLDAHPASRNIVTINAWNEWGEGSYLEPDAIHKMAYLNAVRAVFPP